MRFKCLYHLAVDMAEHFLEQLGGFPAKTSIDSMVPTVLLTR